jgi:hypothetical protein
MNAIILQKPHKITLLEITDSGNSKGWKSDGKLKIYIRYPT